MSHQVPPSCRARGLRIVHVLLLVALVPLIGVGSVTWSRLVQARADHDRAMATQSLAREVVHLARLDAAMVAETNWRATAAVVRAMGVPESMVDQTLGLDLARQQHEAGQEVDRLLRGFRSTVVDLGVVRDQVESARATSRDFPAALAEYDAIAANLRLPLFSAVRTLIERAGVDGDRAGLASATRELRTAVQLRTTVSQQMDAYFAILFDVRDVPSLELERLIRLRAELDDELGAMDPEGASSGAVHRALRSVQASQDLAFLRSAVDGLVGRSLVSGLPAHAPPLTPATGVSQAGNFAPVFEATREVADLAIDLVVATGDVVLDAAEAAERTADEAILRANGMALLTLVVSLAVASLATRGIVRPLRRLQGSVQALRDGERVAAVEARVVPVEVRAAAAAIDDAASHLDLVTRQTRALASGDLDAAVLDEEAPGGLGEAVQEAVATLRQALAGEEEFRRRLAHEAAHDGLTQLPNRNASLAQLTRSLARIERAGGRLAVLFIDLDHFKDVNDTHGHPAGDAVLATVSRRLVTGVREGDHVGRLGGDEFLVVAEPVDGPDDAVGLARRLVELVERPIDIGGGTVVRVGASVGIALADGAQLDADELLRDADLAVYRAKAHQRGGVQVCDEDLRRELAEVADLSAALREAIGRDELVLHYQPIVDARSGRLRAVEALVRWRHPDTGELVPPDRFIGVAERTSLIVDLDRWVLDAAAAQLAEWTDELADRLVPVSVNVSRRHLAEEQFVEHVVAPFARRGLPLRSVVLEVTESAVLDDLGVAAAKLQQLRDRGAAVAIDDFGTGYTSLAHLRSLPVDVLKIDRSLTATATTDAHEQSILKLIIDTGHLLGTTITAEGIETEEEAALLARLGSDHLQGYWFGRPMPADALDLGPQRSAQPFR